MPYVRLILGAMQQQQLIATRSTSLLAGLGMYSDQDVARCNR
jgi:hypothetical protein